VSHVERIRSAWAEVLDVPVESVPLDVNFFEVGGTSLLLVLLADVLNESQDEPLDVIDLFQHSTVATQAALLTKVDTHG
jgi:Phosphopantetheine attachment site